jgi:hypothetical protein
MKRRAYLVISDKLFDLLRNCDDDEYNRIVDDIEGMAAGFGLGVPVQVHSHSGRSTELVKRG